MLFVSYAYSVEIISHRGNCCGEQENSLAGIEKAWEAGADGVEVDLRVSRDNVIFLFHDEQLKGKPISSLSFSDIQHIDKNIPALSLLLNAPIPSGYYLFDLKESYKEYLDVLSKTIKQSEFPEENISFQSKSLESLIYLRKKHPKSRYIYLTKLKRTAPWYGAPDPEKIRRRLSKYNINAVSMKGRKFIDKAYIETLKKGNTSVFIWTINDAKRAQRYMEFGVNGIITDKVKGIKKINKK